MLNYHYKNIAARPMFVSIVIPTRNAASLLPACLERINAQDYPHHLMEIIVADGCSSDTSQQAAESFRLNTIRFQFLKLEKPGRAYGLNQAIRLARGDAICRLDVRTRIDPAYVRMCVETLLATGASNVGGLQVPLGSGLVQTAIGMAMAHSFGVGNAKFRIARQSGFVDSVYLGFFRRQIFDEVGLFDESSILLSEDSDMNERIRRSGRTVYLNVAIRAAYEPRETLRDQCLLYFRYGGARAGNLRKHRQLTSIRQLAAPMFVLLFISLPIAGIAWKGFLVAWAILVSTYLTFDLLASVQLCLRRKRLAPIVVLPLVFPCMHFCWAFGFFRWLAVPDVDCSE